MKKTLILLLVLSGCLNTENREIPMKSSAKSDDIASTNSGIHVEANPKNADEKEVEYFENNSIKNPK